VSGQLHAPAALPPGKEPPGTHWIGGWMAPRAGLENLEKRTFFNLVRLELRPLSRPAYNQSLYLVTGHFILFYSWLLPRHNSNYTANNDSMLVLN
jgi:hypothetical protein